MVIGTRWSAIATALLLQGCDINYATFVTASHLGIKADTTTEQVSIGVGRTDLFIGPGYPDIGAAPSAFGYLQTDAAVFSPKVTQLYATGAAADTVTQSATPSQTGNANTQDLAGSRRPLVFGTNTDVGLKLGFVANAPTSINLGYDREEVSIIPMRKSLGSSDKDTYAPVLASVALNVASTTPTGSNLALSQFFATGQAALNLAGRDEIRNVFKATAKAQVDQAALQAAVDAANGHVAAVKAYLDSAGGYPGTCTALKSRPDFHPELWKPVADPCALSETEFVKQLNLRPDITSTTLKAISTVQ